MYVWPIRTYHVQGLCYMCGIIRGVFPGAAAKPLEPIQDVSLEGRQFGIFMIAILFGVVAHPLPPAHLLLKCAPVLN